MKHCSEWCILHRNSAKGKNPPTVIPAPGRDIPYLLSLTAGEWFSPPNNEQTHKTHMDQCHTTCTGFSLQFSILAASWKEFDGDLLNDTHIENWGIERKLQHMLTCTRTCRDL